jgi:hypothetical protein
LRRDFLSHLLFRDALFASPKYAGFTTAVLAVADTFRHEDPYLVTIAKAIPSVSKRLRSITDIIQTGQASYAIALAQVTGSLNELTAKLEDFLTGSFSLIFTPGRSRILP